MKKILVFLMIFSLPLWAGTFEKTLEKYRSPAVDSEAHLLSNFDFTCANTTFVLSGKVAALKAGDQEVGFVFEGEGSIAVKLAEGPWYRGNVTTLWEDFATKPDENDQIRDTFKRALFFTNQIPDKLFKGEATSPEGLADVMKKQFERLEDSPYGLPDHDIALTTFNPHPKQVIWALLDGGSSDGSYYCDPNYDNLEFYGHWTKTKYGYGMKPAINQVVNFQPRKHPKLPFLQTDIDIEVVSRDNEFITEKTTMEITSGTNGLQLVRLDLVNGTSRVYTLWNKRSDPFTVTAVKDAEGKVLPFSHRYDQLIVKLPRALKRGDTFRFTVEAEGNLLKNFFGDSYRVLGNFSYMPQPDLSQVHATFHSIVKVKDPYIAMGTGVNIKRWKEGDMNCLETREERPISFPFLIVGNFEITEKKKKDYDVKVYSYVMGKEKAGKRLVKNALAILDFYSNGMVTFPYKELEVVEIPYQRHFFWQAPAGITEVTSEAFNPIGGDESDIDTWFRRWFSNGQNARFAHELGHQWFGNLVGMSTDYDNWFSEAFAEYLSYMFMKDGAKDKTKAKQVKDNWKNMTKECGDKGTVYGATSASNYYTCLIYGKGPYVMQALRDEIGDEAFFKFMKIITTAAAKKNMKAITEDFILIINHVTGKDYRGWFDKYIFGEEIPEWKS